ncbi:MAG: efflux RND transporter periplasmic adaptor subunit [Quisquiliibacterium sp.]
MSRRILMIILLAALLGAAGLAYRGQSEKPPGKEQAAKTVGPSQASANPGKAAARAPVPVVTALIERRDLPVVFSSIGRAEAPQTVAIRARVDGVIQSVRFKPGQQVRRGDVLIELDARQIEAQLRQSQGNLARDQANLVKARADLARYTDLAARKFVAPSAVDGYSAAVQAAQAVVEFDQAGVDYARVQLEHTKIRAPMDGVAGALQVFAGSNVKANDTVIVTVNQLRPILVSFAVPQSQLPGLRELQAKGPVTVSGVAKDSGQDARTGGLVFIDNAIDASTGTITLKAQFDNLDQGWTPGQFVNVSLVSKVIRDALVVPVEAIQMGPSGNIAFQVLDGKAQVRPVKAFSVAGAHAVLGADFKAGDKLVIDGQMRLTPGASVLERGANAAASARPARPKGSGTDPGRAGASRSGDAQGKPPGKSGAKDPA